jgi:ABC-2 type transport system ATP-binding protein
MKMKGYAITVENLSKVFKSKIRQEGFIGTIKSIFKPRYTSINAVDNISFNVAEGELVAFIGPNGAGKSTTLKMLSGILYPDSGTISVLGLDPQKDRKKLAYDIGTVFGQKPQLWFHLPAIDSFNLFSKIYEIPENVYRARLKSLVDRFEIAEFINQPVRKLSLGQRMRCELVLSLLHKPKILYLDEPTIGLDIVVKKNIRELIKEINDKDKVTVILTSHDMGDIEKICDRTIIINKGTLVYDGKLKDLKKRYIKTKLIKVLAENPIIVPKGKGITLIKKGKFGAKIEVDTEKMTLKHFIDMLMSKNSILDLNVEEPPIEEIIEEVYKR